MVARARAVVVAAAGLLAATPGTPADAGREHLTAGVFLYAAPGVEAGLFVESVVLLVQHGKGGSLGLIVNRPTRLPVREALPQLGELKELGLALYFGGPVQPEAILALVRPVKPLDEGLRVLPGVYFSTDLGPVKEAARRPETGSRLRVYAGYAGWGPGQLAAELRAGAWVVGPASASAVFTAEPSTLWPQVHDLLRRTVARRLGSPARTQSLAGSTSSSKPTVGEPRGPNQATPSATRSISIR